MSSFTDDMDISWYQVSDSPIQANSRMHVRINGRFITLFHYRNSITAIDSVCHHAGGPLTEGPLQDIEELNTTVVLCPWHRYMVSLDGYKVFQSVDFENGKAQEVGWKKGKMVQRAHRVHADSEGTYIGIASTTSGGEAGVCGSDQHASSELCGSLFAVHMHSFEPIRLETHPYAALR